MDRQWKSASYGGKKIYQNLEDFKRGITIIVPEEAMNKPHHSRPSLASENWQEMHRNDFMPENQEDMNREILELIIQLTISVWTLNLG